MTQGRWLIAVLLILTPLAACSSERPAPSPSPSAATPVEPVALDLAVYGPPEVVAAYTELTTAFNERHPEITVTVSGFATRGEARRAVREQAAAGDPPDLFLTDHGDLAGLVSQGRTQRVDQLLGERKVDFGDGYQRTGLEAFSAEAALQCMPVDVSPMVVYYNKALIDLATVEPPDSRPIDPQKGWNLEQFAAAAAQAAAAPGTKGVHIAADLSQIAPFIWSGDGEIIDDEQAPTTLTLSEDSSVEALEQLLEIVRDPTLTFDRAALRREPALERFIDGELGMVLGYRELTPRLRSHPELDFDVMALPKLSQSTTVVQMKGLCMSAGIQEPGAAADLLTYLVSDESAARLAQTGYVVPVNVSVINDDDFTQLGQRPANAAIIPGQVRGARLLPETPRWPRVVRQTRPAISALFYDPVIEPLDERLAAIDAASQPILEQSTPPSPSPSASGSAGD